MRTLKGEENVQRGDIIVRNDGTAFLIPEEYGVILSGPKTAGQWIEEFHTESLIEEEHPSHVVRADDPVSQILVEVLRDQGSLLDWVYENTRPDSMKYPDVDRKDKEKKGFMGRLKRLFE